MTLIPIYIPFIPGRANGSKGHTMVGEPVGDHLAVVPTCDDNGWTGGWGVYHRATGLHIPGLAVGLQCARRAAWQLDQLGIDWTAMTEHPERNKELAGDAFESVKTIVHDHREVCSATVCAHPMGCPPDWAEAAE